MEDSSLYASYSPKPTELPELKMPTWAHRLSEFIPTSSPYFGRFLLRLDEIESLGVQVTDEVMRDVIMDIHQHDQVKKDRSAKLQADRKYQVVYYMRIGNRVKIGTSTNLKVRLEAINPEELMCTEPGGHPLEKQRHHQFAELRTHGEWFRLEGELQQHIERLRSQAPVVDDPSSRCNTWSTPEVRP